jgi:hypothetical protein
MPKYGPIGSYGQNQAIWALVMAKNGPKTAETWARRQKMTQTGNYTGNSKYTMAGPK